MLKADLHIHTSEDPKDKFIGYDSKELIDHASILGFDVIAITPHEKVIYTKKLADYAKQKNILLLPGVELKIEGRHVLVYNLMQKDAEKIKTFSDLKNIKKRKNILVIAPHPYYFFFSGLGKKLKENIELFDAIEYHLFYFAWFNRLNKKAKKTAKENKKPLVGTSDAHQLWQINTTYTLIDSKKDIASVISAIKKGKVRVVSKPITLFRAITAFLNSLKQKK